MNLWLDFMLDLSYLCGFMISMDFDMFHVWYICGLWYRHVDLWYIYIYTYVAVHVKNREKTKNKKNPSFAGSEDGWLSAKIFYFSKKFFAESQPGRLSTKLFLKKIKSLCWEPARLALGKDDVTIDVPGRRRRFCRGRFWPSAKSLPRALCREPRGRLLAKPLPRAFRPLLRAPGSRQRRRIRQEPNILEKLVWLNSKNVHRIPNKGCKKAIKMLNNLVSLQNTQRYYAGGRFSYATRL